MATPFDKAAAGKVAEHARNSFARRADPAGDVAVDGNRRDFRRVVRVEARLGKAEDLGVNPVVDGTMIRLPIPAPTAERRQELAKQAHKYAEAHRVAVRNVRRDGMDLLKKLEKDGKMSEDDHRANSTKVQELTDKLIKEIDQTVQAKEAEIHKV